MAQHGFDRMRYVVRKLFDLKLQLHAIEAEPSLPLPVDVIEYTIALMLDLYSSGYTFVIPIHLYVYLFVVAIGWKATTTNEHLYKVVNCVNCVNMYI